MRRISPVIPLIWLATLAFSGYLLVALATLKTSIELGAQSRALALSRLIAEHASNSFDLTDLVLHSVVDQLDNAVVREPGALTDTSRRAVESMLKATQARSKGIVSMSVTDANGIVYANTVGTPPGVSLADRAYFLALKPDQAPQPVLSEPIFGRVSKKWGIQVARRIQLPDRQFAGMVVANLGIADAFENFYRSLSLEADMFITLRYIDNHVLVRFPGVESKLGTSLTGSAATQAVLDGDAERVIRSVSPIDGIERIVGLRKVDRYPVYASVGLSTAAVFKEWHAQVNITAFMILGACASALGLTMAVRKRERIARELEQHRHRLEVLVRTDPLTGAANRRHFVEQAQLEILRVNRDGTPLSLLMMDLDHFKRINDTWGHAAGDLVLGNFGRVALVPLRATDLLARVGGEEFAVLLPNTTQEGAIEVALRVLSATRQQVVECNGGPVSYTVSIGVASLINGETSYEPMLSRADAALYRAKSEGRDRVFAEGAASPS